MYPGVFCNIRSILGIIDIFTMLLHQYYRLSIIIIIIIQRFVTYRSVVVIHNDKHNTGEGLKG